MRVFLIAALLFLASATTTFAATFGDLLKDDYKPPVSSTEETNRKKAEQIANFLRMLEDRGKKSLAEFNKNLKPTVPASNPLADNVAGYFTTPIPTLNPKLEDILARINQKPIDEYFRSDYPIGQTNTKPAKSIYTIALLGDSMTDTLGKDLTHLKQLLRQDYPYHDFFLLNYGQGATDMESGLIRLTNQTTYLNEIYPPLLHYHPDIIIVESFAYNHWGPLLSDLDRQWLTIAKIIDTIKQYSAETSIILATTIAPNPDIYGDGKLNWPKNLKWDAAITTKAYLQNMINFASTQYYPLADAYTASLGPDAHGQRKFIDLTDNLHPSEEGKILYSQKIAEVIKSLNLIR